jgi:hypothetical protein
MLDFFSYLCYNVGVKYSPGLYKGKGKQYEKESIVVTRYIGGRSFDFRMWKV